MSNSEQPTGGPLGNASVNASVSNKDESADNSRTQIDVLNNATINQSGLSSININMSNLGAKLRLQPWWVQIAAVLLLLSALYAIYAFIDNYYIKQGRFNAAIDASISKHKSEFMSANNVILSTIPDNILQENGPKQWSAISRLWVRSGETIETVYSDAAKCLEEGTCSTGGGSNPFCKKALTLKDAFEQNLESLQQISGITINRSQESPLVPFGEGVVDIPDLVNLTIVANHCKA